MMSHTDIEMLLYDFVQGSLSAEEQAEVELHVASCNECSEALAALREVVALLPPVHHRPSDDRPAEFWSALIDAVAPAPPQRARGVAGRLREYLAVHRWQGFAAAASAAALLVSLSVWKLVPPAGPPRVEEIAPPEAALPAGQLDDVPEAQRQRARDYFERSKVLLVGLTNMKTVGGAPPDLSVEQKVSLELIEEAQTLRLNQLDPRSLRLVSDLDRVLRELARAEPGEGPPDLVLIRERIHADNLLFKVRMAGALHATTPITEARDEK